MPGGRLGKATVGFHFHGMDEVGKFDGILNEEDRDVVPNQIPVAFLGVKLDANPRTSRGVSTEPAPPATVEIRVKTGVFSPTSVSILAVVYCCNEAVSSKNPCTPVARA